jgi:hypothetical protein
MPNNETPFQAYLRTWCPKCRQIHNFMFVQSKTQKNIIFHEYGFECGANIGLFHMIPGQPDNVEPRKVSVVV